MVAASVLVLQTGKALIHEAPGAAGVIGRPHQQLPVLHRHLQSALLVAAARGHPAPSMVLPQQHLHQWHLHVQRLGAVKQASIHHRLGVVFHRQQPA